MLRYPIPYLQREAFYCLVPSPVVGPMRSPKCGTHSGFSPLTGTLLSSSSGGTYIVIFHIQDPSRVRGSKQSYGTGGAEACEVTSIKIKAKVKVVAPTHEACVS